MTTCSPPRWFALCLFIVVLLAFPGCRSAGSEASGQAAGAGLSGPLEILPDYQARAPRKCASLTRPPSAAQAAVMVQCTMDSVSPGGLGLVQDVKLDLGKPRAFVYWTDAGLSGIDLQAQVYPLRGSYSNYNCRLISNMAPAGKSCLKSTVSRAIGWCWKTSFGDWKCKMQGDAGGKVTSEFGPAPQTF